MGREISTLGSCLGLLLLASVSLTQLCSSSISETEMSYKGVDQKNVTTSQNERKRIRILPDLESYKY